MVKAYGMEFATSIGVLFTLRAAHGCKTLQETYKLFENASEDSIFEILSVAYNKQNGTKLTAEEFVDLVGEKSIGFLALADIFQQVTEAILYDGLTPEQIEDKKKMLQKKKR